MIEITPRVITVLIAFPVVIGIFAVLGILILRKDIKYWGNRFYALFFWIVAAGLTFNVSYIFSENLSLIKILNITTIECVNVGIIALLLGNLVIYKGEQYVIGNKKSYLFILAIFIAIISHIYTPEVLTNLEDPRIIWAFPFGLFELILSQVIMGTVLYLSSIFYRELPQKLQGKFKRFIIGLILMDIALLLITTGNMQLIPTTTSFITIILFLSLVLGSILIYFGIVRKK